MGTLSAARVAALMVLVWPPLDGARAEEPSLVPCLGLAADQSPVFPTQVFPDPTLEVSACFRLGAEEGAEKLSAVFIAEDVGDAAPQNYAIVEASLDLNGERQGRFRFENPRPMPVGDYRVEVSADGRPWASTAYSIIAPAAVEAEGELLPLQTGRVWTYRFQQTVGDKANLELPDIQPDAQGVYRATVTMEVAGQDDAGLRLVTSRNGKLVFEEWWRRGEEGWLVTRRRQGEEVIALDPPQLLVGTGGGEREWEYPVFGQTFNMWGPFPMQGEWGEASGYVVLARQAQPPFSITVERHFVPGVGMVREVIVQALAGGMLSRQELELISAGD